MHRELTAYREYRDRRWDLAYWRLASGVEVDFVLAAPGMHAAIEVKSSSRIADHHLGELGALALDHHRVRRRIVVSLEPKRRVTADGIEILPVAAFLDRRWKGEFD